MYRNLNIQITNVSETGLEYLYQKQLYYPIWSRSFEYN